MSYFVINPPLFGDRQSISSHLLSYRTQFGTKCNFDYEDPVTGEKWDRCRVYTQEGIAFNVHQCIDQWVSKFL